MKELKEFTPEEQIVDNQLDYLAEILVEAFMEQKGYEPIPWLNGEKQWRKIK